MYTSTTQYLRNIRWAIVIAIVVGFAGMNHQWKTVWAQAGDGSESPSAGATTDAAGGGSSARKPVDTGERTVLQSLRESRWVGAVIFLLSIGAVGLIVEHSLTIRKGILMPDELIAQLDDLIRQGQLKDAEALCQEPANVCLFSNVVLAGLQRFQGSEFGFAEYKAAVEESGEDQTGTLYRKTEVLGVIGAISPMLGLTGTVLGMIEAFNKIASTGGTARPHELAGGIGQALVTTLMGLLVAIPCMVAFSYFRNRIDSIVAEAGKRVEQVMMPLGRRK